GRRGKSGRVQRHGNRVTDHAEKRGQLIRQGFLLSGRISNCEWLVRPGPKPAKLRQELSGGDSQCLNLEQEIHHNASKPCILGFEALRQSLIAAFGGLSIRTAFWLPSTLSGHSQAHHIFYPA